MRKVHILKRHNYIPLINNELNISNIYESCISSFENDSPLVRGNNIYDSILRNLTIIDELYRTRYPEQKKIHSMVINSLLRLIYKESYGPSLNVIYKYTGYTKETHGCLVAAPRRSGKTEAVGILIAALLVSIPEINILAVAQTFDGACALLDLVKTVLIRSFPAIQLTEEKNNRERLWLKFSLADVRKFTSFSVLKGDSIRGVPVHLLVLEEAAYLPQKIVESTLAPYMQIAPIYGVSTLGSEQTNVYTKMIESGVFETRIITYVCSSCYALGLRTVCPHLKHLYPSHLIREGLDMIQTIFGQSEVSERENLGIANGGNTNYVFNKLLVERLKLQPHRIPNPGKFIFVSVDPNAGSIGVQKSRFAAVSLGCDGTILSILDIDSVFHTDYEKPFVDFLRHLRKFYSSSTIVMDIETNGNMEWSHIVELIGKNKIQCLFIQDHEKKIGSCTTESSKFEMVVIGLKRLQEGTIFMAVNMESPTVLYEQLLEFKRVISQGASKDKPPRIKYTGKESGKPDDVAMTFLRVLLAHQKFFTQERYAKYIVT